VWVKECQSADTWTVQREKCGRQRCTTISCASGVVVIVLVIVFDKTDFQSPQFKRQASSLCFKTSIGEWKLEWCWVSKPKHQAGKARCVAYARAG
jgi:hypothetical protein